MLCILLAVSMAGLLAAPCRAGIQKQVACQHLELKWEFETLSMLAYDIKDVMNLRLVCTDDPASNVARDGGSVRSLVIR